MFGSRRNEIIIMFVGAVPACHLHMHPLMHRCYKLQALALAHALHPAGWYVQLLGTGKMATLRARHTISQHTVMGHMARYQVGNGPL
eukprot:353152-Chlamydomonas_euryale.AAC.4